MKKFDVIIVGAGPAGVAASKILENNNINFCIIEKEKFPREKLCGGGLTHKCSKIIPNLFNLDNIDTKITKYTTITDKNIEKEIKLTHEIVMTDRLELDYNNFKQIKNKNIFESENILKIDNNILITDKDQYEFKYIIFADGVNGYSRKLINNRKFGFCLECNSKTLTDKTILDFNVTKFGYGWIFPKKDHTTIGIGNFSKEKEDYLNEFIRFTEKYKFKFDTKNVKGFHIPIYSNKIYKQSVINNKYILVGDAASLVDPVSGEGIYYALFSGKAAAESIIEVIKKKTNLRKIYLKKTKSMYINLNRRKFLSKLLYSKFKSFFIKLGLSNKLFILYINYLFG